MKRYVLIAALTGVMLGGAWREAPAESEDALRVLYLSKSSGFQHSVVMRHDGAPSHSELALEALAGEMGFTLTSTKDASQINPERLQDFDVVIFYTTGDLTQPGTDEHPPMPENGVDALLDWIRAGGGFVGIHSASDSFHGAEGEVTPFIEMVGGEFLTHGRQFVGTLRAVNPEHPSMEGVPDEWTFLEEWYIFKNLNAEKMHVLALLEPGEEREKQPMYDLPDYPIIWCRAYGDGRVYYNALGHREDVWDHEHFRQMLRSAIRWAGGAGETMAEPNYAEVVPDAAE